MRFDRRQALAGIITGLLAPIARGQREVRTIREDGFVDLDLPLVDLAQQPSNGFRFVARGTLEGKTIGFAGMTAEWKAQPVDNSDITMYVGAVVLQSIGAASDEFVTALAKLYGASTSRLRMLPEIRTEAIGLGTDPRRMEQEPTKLKLFFYPEDEERYAEAYLNIDRVAGVVEFHEKDPEYRENIIKALVA